MNSTRSSCARNYSNPDDGRAGGRTTTLSFSVTFSKCVRVSNLIYFVFMSAASSFVFLSAHVYIYIPVKLMIVDYTVRSRRKFNPVVTYQGPP